MQCREEERRGLFFLRRRKLKFQINHGFPTQTTTHGFFGHNNKTQSDSRLGYTRLQPVLFPHLNSILGMFCQSVMSIHFYCILPSPGSLRS